MSRSNGDTAPKIPYYRPRIHVSSGLAVTSLLGLASIASGVVSGSPGSGTNRISTASQSELLRAIEARTPPDQMASLVANGVAKLIATQAKENVARGKSVGFASSLAIDAAGNEISGGNSVDVHTRDYELHAEYGGNDAMNPAPGSATAVSVTYRPAGSPAHTTSLTRHNGSGSSPAYWDIRGKQAAQPHAQFEYTTQPPFGSLKAPERAADSATIAQASMQMFADLDLINHSL